MKRDWLQLTFNALVCLSALGILALLVDALQKLGFPRCCAPIPLGPA